MKAFGYPTGAPVNSDGLVELQEVSFAGDAQAIRRLGAFLLKQADAMDAKGIRFGHAHAQDEERQWPKSWPDVIVAKDIAP